MGGILTHRAAGPRHKLGIQGPEAHLGPSGPEDKIPPMKALRIFLVSSEVAPFAKTGGLADVSAALARYLSGAGHDVRLLMPKYGGVAKEASLRPHPRLRSIPLPFGKRELSFSVEVAVLPGSDQEVYFLDCPELYGSEDIYVSDEEDPLRFAFLSRAALVVCQHLGWSPDVLHCNDWHTALIPLYLKAGYAWDQLFQDNLGYQGVFPSQRLADLALDEHASMLYQEDLEEGHFSFLKTGLLYADLLTTVSETYAREIQEEELGMGLHELLRARADHLVGIVNGVDYSEWDPATDALLPEPYSAEDLSGKMGCKRALLERFELQASKEVPLFGIVSRLTAQKGFELLPDILPVLLQRESMQLVVLGSGEERYEKYFQWLRDAFPTKVAFYRGYNNELAHWIEAGSDAFLMPSRYEPCGLNQMYSLRYGTVPVVRRTGGLADTVQPYSRDADTGTGFVFDEFVPEALFQAMRACLAAFGEREAWRRMVLRGMAQDFSWERQGAHYVRLYESVTGR